MKKMRLSSLIFVLILIANHLLASVAAAHPLGNFTINHYAGLHLTRDTLTLNYILDMAEIPTFQEIATFDANKNGQADPAEAAGYHRAKCQAIQPNLRLSFNGRPASLRLVSSALEFPPGAGGLPTLRLTCNFQTPLEAGAGNIQVAFENQAYAGRLGWREIVVTGNGVTLQGDLAAMSHSLSQRLTAYPQDQLANPLNQRQVSFGLLPGAAGAHQAAPPGPASQQPGRPAINRNDSFTQLITRPHLSLPSILAALGLAFVWGAAHAFTPGHGKTIVAAYLVGSRGTVRHALFLGLTTTMTHTAGVFALGFLTLFASQFILPEQLYPWLGVVSGALVIGIGLSLFRGRLYGLLGRGGEPHHHSHHQPHTHEPGQYHVHGPGGHSHLPPGANRPVTWRSLLALGISGGLIPCPSALIVMLSAIALQRIGFGLVLIVTFSLGLAGVLTGIGVVWVQARRIFEVAPRQVGLLKPISGSARLLQLLPAASALFITIVGVGITAQALMQTGVLSQL